MTNQQPAWDVAIVDGQPETVINLAAVEELVKLSPLGETEARRRLRAAGVPIAVDPNQDTRTNT